MTRALMKLNGVEDVKIDLGAKTATVAHNGVDVEAMKAAVDDAGYDVVGVE